MKNSTTYDQVTAIILASGKGIRFGMPKAEADYDGKTFLEHITQTLHQAGIAQIHRAVGYQTPDMLQTLRQAVAELTSGNTATSKPASGYLVFPVDFPFVKASTLATLLSEHLEKPNAIIRPSFYGFSGHPIIIPVSLNLHGDDQGKGLRGVILHSGLPIVDIQVEDEGIHRNINRPEDMPA